MVSPHGITRRRFVAGAALTLGAALEAACSSTATSPTPASSASSTTTSPHQTGTPTKPASTAQAQAAPTQSASAAPSPTLAAQAAPQGAGGSVVWSCYTLGEARNAILKDLAKKATAITHNNVTLKIEPGTNYWNNLQMRYTGGGAPDVVVNQVDWIEPGAARGVFVALDDFMTQDKVKLTDYNDYKSWLYQGKSYGLPFQTVGEMVYLNKKLFTAAGIELPKADWDWNACLEIAKKLTKGTGAGKVFGLQFADLSIAQVLGMFILDNGGQVLNKTRDKALYGEDPKAISAAQWVVDRMLTDHVAPTPQAQKGQPDPLLTGKIGMSIHEFWYVANVLKALGDSNVAFLPQPKGPAGTVTPCVGSNAWSIVGSTKVRDQAWALINYLESTEGQTESMQLGTPSLNSVATSDKYLNTYPNQKGDLKQIINLWNTAGHDYFITIDTDAWWSTADNTLQPMYTGEKTVPEAMQESAAAVNSQVFAKRKKS